MRAALLTDDHVFEVVEIAHPDPQPHELVLRVRACGICGSDLKAHTFLPAGSVLGHEFSGEIVAVGSAVRDTWRVGQHVASLPLIACGQCRWCLAESPRTAIESTCWAWRLAGRLRGVCPSRRRTDGGPRCGHRPSGARSSRSRRPAHRGNGRRQGG